MSRPRTNDPSNLTGSSVPATDPIRLKELLTEFQKRHRFLTYSFLEAKKYIPTQKIYKRDVERLRRGLARTRILKDKGTRLHPYLELQISHHAYRLAEKAGEAVGSSHIRAAGKIALEQIGPTRGRPNDQILKLHVAGMVANIQTFADKPVIARRHRNSVYDPHFANGISQIIPKTVESWDPDVTTNQLVNIVRDIRKSYAGKPLHFEDPFPHYNFVTNRDEGDGVRTDLMKAFVPSFPIYCP